MEPHRCTSANAPTFWLWLLTRGGLFIWNSIDLSDLGKSWTTPATTAEGQPGQKPSWRSDNQPHRHITDPDEVLVDRPKEIKRFRVAVEQHGMKLKVTTGGSRKIWAAVAKANREFGEGLAWYNFDYETQEAVIFVPDRTLLIREYILENLGDFDGNYHPGAGADQAGNGA